MDDFSNAAYCASPSDYGLYQRRDDPPDTPTRYRLLDGVYHVKLSPEELTTYRAPYVAPPPTPAPPEPTPPYDFAEAFPTPVSAHVVINGEVSDAKALRDAARTFSGEALAYIITVMRFSRDEKVKLQAADLILNRAIGKPVAPTGVMEGSELMAALGSIVLPEKRRTSDIVSEGVATP